ncbi:MAG TPA: DUF4215 domain-containing protein [Myxococcota bacterium]|jgi:cysteine-rich repeat protein|nr:DUF4215 domain-containing protein [Myxococcota bacterium]
MMTTHGHRPEFTFLPSRRRPQRRAPSLVVLLLAAPGGLAVLGCGGPPRDAGPGTDARDTGAVCGNGITEVAEECDDGNLTSGDGCTDTCLDEGPLVVCGNGVVEAGETCDDGGTTAGDGCDAACQIEPFACTVAGSIACGDTVTANTADGTNGRADHCGAAEGGWTGPELVYQFDDPAAEGVTFSLVATVDPGAPPGAAPPPLDVVAVAAPCESIACAGGAMRPKPAGLPGAAPPLETAAFAAAAGTSYFVYVDGFAGAAGGFTLHAGCETEALCGDGLLQGGPAPAGEACDDGNLLSGDGCTSTCRAEAPPPLCVRNALAPVDLRPVGASVAVVLDTTAFLDHGALSCSAAVPGCAGGPDAVIEIILPAGAADLDVAFDQTPPGDHFLAVTALSPDTCAERACVDPYPAAAGTHTFAGLSDGAPDTVVWLVVDACTPATAGPLGLVLTAR